MAKTKTDKPNKAQKTLSEALSRESEEMNVEKVEKVTAPKKTGVTKQKVARVRGKKYLAAKKSMNPNTEGSKILSIDEAVTKVKSMSFAKFDESVELTLNVLETGLKGEVTLPFSTGKMVRVAIADDALISKLEQNTVDFDVLLASPAMMPKLTKFAKLLGPKGLMPSPKSGTISANPSDLMPKFQGNNVRYKTEAKAPIIHIVVGKVSSKPEDLGQNISAIILSVGKSKITSTYLKSTMSPSVRVAF